MKLSDAAAAKLLDLINVQKKYLPGDKLPNEATLAVELGVSRTTTRSAVQHLVGQGILEIHLGRGTYVARPDQNQDSFKFDSLNVSHLKLRDLYELRLALEPQMAYYAALRATDEELAYIMKVGTRVVQLGDRPVATSQENDADEKNNYSFHDAVVKATHNEFNISLMNLLNAALGKALLESDSKPIMYPGSPMEHELIMGFLCARNPDGAKLAMELHLKQAMKTYGI